MTPANQFSLSGKVAVITGSSRGIGKAIAEAFAAAGASVVVSARNAELTENVAAAIVARGGRATGMPADVRNAADVKRLMQATAERLGRLDILVNSAGISPYWKDAEQMSEAEWDEIIAVNLKGTFLCAQAAGRVMIPQKAGRIINMSSVAGRVALPNLVAYCAAKGGVEQITKVLAVEWAEHHILVNAIAPGYVETDLTKGIQKRPKLQEAIGRQTPLGRMAKAEEVTGAAIYLASEASAYVTGQTIVVDGGWTAI
jgi:gluconate 5-dehydrogenase